MAHLALQLRHHACSGGPAQDLKCSGSAPHSRAETQGKTPRLRRPPPRMARRWDRFRWSPGTGAVPPTAERGLPVPAGALQPPPPEASLPGPADRAHRRRAPAVAWTGKSARGSANPPRRRMRPRRPQKALPSVPVRLPRTCRLGLPPRAPQGGTPLLRRPPPRIARRWDGLRWPPGTGGAPPAAERRLPVLAGALRPPLLQAKRPEVVRRQAVSPASACLPRIRRLPCWQRLPWEAPPCLARGLRRRERGLGRRRPLGCVCPSPLRPPPPHRPLRTPPVCSRPAGLQARTWSCWRPAGRSSAGADWPRCLRGSRRASPGSPAEPRPWRLRARASAAANSWGGARGSSCRLPPCYSQSPHACTAGMLRSRAAKIR
mmetsp:Transcript_72339/g.225555  ORF Transcript_72339/g.225555 Transcript_72339/m.225555 type:complete len:375 (-) Transcript_72339:463-1587(-)